MECFKIEVDSDGIALITWDMPGRTMNVLAENARNEIREWTKKIAEDDQIKGAVLTSGKDGSFCAGADLEEILSGATFGRPPSVDSPEGEKAMRAAFELAFAWNRMMRDIETCGKPVAAAINGLALGGGFEITLACHYRVIADNPKIKLGLPEAKVGLLPGAGGTQRLPRLIGAANALPLILEGKDMDPMTAAKLGAVHKVVPSKDLVAEAKRWVKEEGNAEQPWDKKGFKIPGGGPEEGDNPQNFAVGIALLHGRTYGNYPAQEAIMSAVYEGLHVPIDTALAIESRYLISLLQRPGGTNMIRSLFVSTGELNKGARRPAGLPANDVAKVGILGAGMMGAAIAYVSAMAGIDCVLIDQNQEAAEKGKSYSASVQDKAIAKGRSTAENKEKILSRITPTTDYSLLQGADLVIEAVFEDRQIKADVTAKAEAVIPETSIFGSNTSTLPITGLAEATSRPSNFIGVHFFSPVDRMPLVEIIRGQKTSDQALAVALDFAKKIRKTPIVVNDSRGFYTSRCFGTYVNEGLYMLSEGILPPLIENAGKMTGMPVAPLAMLDEVSIELSYHVKKQTQKDLGKDYKVTPVDTIEEKMVAELGRLGRKNGKGFYEYPDKGKKYLWPGLSDIVKPRPDQPDVEELKTRLLYIQALETARCFEENVLTDVRDADVGAIMGWGFAPYTGGPLSFIDTVGTANFVAECDRLAQKYGERFKPNALLRDMAEKGDTFYGRFNPKNKKAA